MKNRLWYFLFLLLLVPFIMGPVQRKEIRDDAYNATTWDGDNIFGASRNALRDKLESMSSSSHALTHADGGADEVTISPPQIPLNEGQVLVGQVTTNVAGATSTIPNLAVGCSTTTLSADNTMSCNKLVAEINGGESINQYQLVYMKSDGKFWKANGDQGAGPLGPAAGITTAACTADNECIICQSGCIRDDAWTGQTVGGAVYLDDTAGVLTQTANATTGDIHQIIGFAYSDVIINFDFSRPYSLVD